MFRWESQGSRKMPEFPPWMTNFIPHNIFQSDLVLFRVPSGLECIEVVDAQVPSSFEHSISLSRGRERAAEGQPLVVPALSFLSLVSLTRGDGTVFHLMWCVWSFPICLKHKLMLFLWPEKVKYSNRHDKLLITKTQGYRYTRLLTHCSASRSLE